MSDVIASMGVALPPQAPTITRKAEDLSENMPGVYRVRRACGRLYPSNSSPFVLRPRDRGGRGLGSSMLPLRLENREGAQELVIRLTARHALLSPLIAYFAAPWRSRQVGA